MTRKDLTVNRPEEDQLKIGLGHIFALAHGENDGAAMRM
jgi:hypothetical protein